MTSPLHTALAHALEIRQQSSIPVLDLLQPTPSSGPDLSSNDYLCLTSDPLMRTLFLRKLSTSANILGSGGSRLLTGNSRAHLAFENRMKDLFGAPAALLCNSGYDANVSFWHSVPQRGDVIVLDELVHASTRDGIAKSRARSSLYPFTHNSATSFRECVVRAMEENPAIAAGHATLFVAVEGLYSMHGDFSPLSDIVRVTRELVPRDCSHIVIDEAHSTGICGPDGLGLVFALGLQKEVDSVIHTFGKGRAASGAVILTTPIVRKFVINYGRPVIYSTAIPCSTICALEASFDYIGSPTGAELRAGLRHIADYFTRILNEAFEHVPPNLLSLRPRAVPSYFPADVVSPIFPILTEHPMQLSAFLHEHGYPTTPIPYPVVPRGEERIRLVVHKDNTEDELSKLVECLVAWATSMMTDSTATVREAMVPRLQARL